MVNKKGSAKEALISVFTSHSYPDNEYVITNLPSRGLSKELKGGYER